MLVTVFRNILLMSAAGSILIVFLLCLKPVTRKLFSPKWRYYIWLTVLIVLILPVSFTLPQRTPDIQPPQIQTAAMNAEITENHIQTAIPPALPEISRIPVNIMRYLSIIWLLGAISVLLAKMVKYLIFLNAIRKNSYEDNTVPNLPEKLGARRTQLLDAPLIIGLIKPVLYLPDIELTQNALNYILMHELIHYRRHDLLYKWFTAFVLSIHWFNPLIYAVSKQIDMECEISCDFAAVGNLSEQEKNNYMKTILDMLCVSKKHTQLLTTQMAGSKKILKRRFAMIKTNKSSGKIISALSAVTALMALSAAIFASGILSGRMKDNTADIVTADTDDNNITADTYDGGEELDKAEPDAADDEWYKRDTFFTDADGHTLEVVLYGDGLLQFIREDHSFYYTYIDKVKYENNWRIYDCNYGATAIYYPGNPAHIEIYDKNEQTLYTAEDKAYSAAQQTSGKSNDNQEMVKSFFDAFSKSDFALMKNYCTENCMRFFGDGQVFGMKRAELTEMNTDFREYVKSSNDFRVFVTVNMTPHELSVFDPSDTETSFYVVLMRQPDGRYLIDDFVTG